MSLTLQVNDAGNGSGGSAVIAGSAGAANQVYYSPWTGKMQLQDGSGTSIQYAWTLGGSITGDGTVTLAIPTGFYIFLLVSNGAVACTVYQNFTGGPTISEHSKCLNAFLTGITSLNLQNIKATAILKQWYPTLWRGLDTALLPICTIAPCGVMDYPGMVTGSDDIANPVIVSFFDSLNQDTSKNIDRDLLWRQRVSRLFRSQQLPGVPSVWVVKVVEAPVFDPDALQKGIWASILPFNCISREPRGLAAT